MSLPLCIRFSWTYIKKKKYTIIYPGLERLKCNQFELDYMYTSLVTLESECEEYGITLIPPIDFICEEAPKSYEIQTSRAYLYGISKEFANGYVSPNPSTTKMQ